MAHGPGRGSTATGLRPDERHIRQSVVPALVKALEGECCNDILTGCPIALAKLVARRHEVRGVEQRDRRPRAARRIVWKLGFEGSAARSAEARAERDAPPEGASSSHGSTCPS